MTGTMGSFTAIILAGGSGERLRPLTDDRPKIMIEVAGTPILFHQLAWLRRHGVTKVIVACGYRHAVIAAALAQADLGDTEVVLSVEPRKLGRGGALKLACQTPPPDGPFLALNGDLMTDFDLGDLLDQHTASGVLATIAIAPLRSPHGIALVTGDKVQAFQEKPWLPHWINAGVYALSPALIPRFPDLGDHEERLFPELAAAGQLGAFRVPGFWRSIDTVKDVSEVSAELGFLERQT
jgi:NDP-sugar pyrophosphorylase family protein